MPISHLVMTLQNQVLDKILKNMYIIIRRHLKQVVDNKNWLDLFSFPYHKILYYLYLKCIQYNIYI